MVGALLSEREAVKLWRMLQKKADAVICLDHGDGRMHWMACAESYLKLLRGARLRGSTVRIACIIRLKQRTASNG